MILRSRTRGLVPLALALLLGGCWHPPANRSHASAATLAACRQRADEVYDRQNRAEIYQSDTYATSTRDSPYADFGLPGITTNGLSGRYQHAQLEDDCINASDHDAGGTAIPTGSPTVVSPAPDIVRGTALPPPRP